jgi:hypothetical protein
MIRKTKHATTNYRALLPFLSVVDQNGSHKRFISDGFMDLVIEDLNAKDYEGREIYSISHYGEQNRDLMADPDMEIAVDRRYGEIVPRTFRNDYLGLFQEVFKEKNGKIYYSERLLIDLDSFLWHWLKNIQAQGFIAV